MSNLVHGHDIHVDSSAAICSQTKGEEGKDSTCLMAKKQQPEKDEESTAGALWVMSLGYETQEDTDLWKTRGGGKVLKDQHRYIAQALANDPNHATKEFRANDNSVGSAVLQTIHWHHSDENRKAKWTYLEGEAVYLLVDIHHIPSLEKKAHSNADPEIMRSLLVKKDYISSTLATLGKELDQVIRDFKSRETRRSALWYWISLERLLLHSWPRCFGISSRKTILGPNRSTSSI